MHAHYHRTMGVKCGIAGWGEMWLRQAEVRLGFDEQSGNQPPRAVAYYPVPYWTQSLLNQTTHNPIKQRTSTRVASMKQWTTQNLTPQSLDCLCNDQTGTTTSQKLSNSAVKKADSATCPLLRNRMEQNLAFV